MEHPLLHSRACDYYQHGCRELVVVEYQGPDGIIHGLCQHHHHAIVRLLQEEANKIRPKLENGYLITALKGETGNGRGHGYHDRDY